MGGWTDIRTAKHNSPLLSCGGVKKKRVAFCIGFECI